MDPQTEHPLTYQQLVELRQTARDGITKAMAGTGDAAADGYLMIEQALEALTDWTTVPKSAINPWPPIDPASLVDTDCCQ